MKLVKMLKIAALSCVSLIGMSQAASAEPISIAIVTALGIAGGTTLFATAVAVTNFALGLAVNFGLSLLAGALAKKPKQQGGSQTQVQYSADAYRIIPFGTVAIAGREVYWKGVGKKNKTNCYVIQLADWQCHQLRAVWVNGVRKTLTPVAVVGTEAARYEVQSFGSKFIVKWFPGTTAQTADSELITMSADTAGGSIGGWTADHIGKGVCYVSFIIEYDEELMPARPQLLWELDGALLYDWRKDSTNGGSGAHRWDDPATWEFSSNPAVCDYNWCRGFWRNGMLLAGIGAASYDLLHSAYTTAANICDETLDDGGGSRKRYVVSVIINADGEHRIAREAFIAAMAGDGVERGGQFAVLAGAAYSPVMTLTDDDMASAHSFKFQQKSPLSEIYNAVHVTWLNLDQPWSAHTLTPLTDSQYEDQDGGQRIARDIDLAMVPNPYQARAIGKVVLEQSRMQAIHTGVYGGKTAVLEPGDWVTRQFNRDTGFGVSSFLDTDPYGFDASALTDSYLNRMGTDELTMKVVSKRRAGPELYELTLRQCAAANFTAPAGPITVAGQPVVTPPVYTPATPGTPALVETVSINADGAAVSTITATWTASADAASYVISIKEGSADWVDRRLGNVLIYSFRGRTGVTYQARVRAIDNSDLLSLWSGTASILVTGDTTAPAAPSGLSAAGMLGRIVLSWTNPGDGDLAGTEIWEAATDNFASAALTHTTAAPDQMWVRDNLGISVTRYYWIKARDRTGNVSTRYPAGGGVSGTTTPLSGGDVDTSPPSVPTGLAVSSAAAIAADGTTIVKMMASWNKVADTDLGYYEIGVLESGGNEVIFQVGASGSATERFEWPSVKPNMLYTLRIRALDIFSNKSAFSSTVNHTTAKDAVAPATPTGLSATAGFESVWLQWTANSEADLLEYDVYTLGTAAPAPGAGTAASFKTRATSLLVQNLTPGVIRYYWIRAVDTSDNKSAWTASVNATPVKIESGDIAAGAVGTASFASGLVPVEIVATLPVSGNFAGRMVFLTSDNKLYRHNGTAFVATIPAADVTGQITTTQITDDAISTPKLAAGAVVTAKLAAGAVTANELAANSVISGKIQAGAVAANELAAGSVIASKLAVTDLTNLIQDPLFGDTNYWGSTAGWSFQTNPTGPGDDFDAATALGAATVLKTPTGNGTTSQSATALALASGQRGSVEGGKVYRLSAKGYVTAGFTGRLRLQATWYAADNVTTVGTSNVFGTDYTSSAAGAATSEVLEGQATAPANAVFLRFRFYIGWSSTLNNAGTGYFAFPFVNRAASGKLIVDGSIEAVHLTTGELITNTAQIKDAIVSEAKISGTLSAAKLTAGTALANSITVNGTALSTVASDAALGAQDPGTRVNAGSTQIDPGKVLISGGTSLADWRKGGDETKIDGGDISANTIQANAVTVGLRGLTIEGLEFAHNSPSSNRVSWTAGTIRYVNDGGTLVTAAISGSDVAWSTGVLYVYWVQGATTLSATTNAATAHGSNNVVLAAYQGGTNLVANYGRTIIDGSKITTGTVDAAQLKANAVTSDKITAGAITASKLLIADFTNSVINSDFGGNTADGYYQANGSATIIAVTPRGGASEPLMSAPTDYVASVGSGAQATQCGVFKMPCKAGEEYYVEVLVAGASGSTKTAYLAAHWYTLASGSSTQINITGTGFVPGTTWSTLSGTLTIPAGATAVSIGVRHNNAAGPIYFTKLRVIRRASADLVVDGAITAVKMNVTSLSAINANMGTLTAGKILGSNGFEIDATNERITSSNFVDGKAGFRLDGVSGSVKAYSGEFAGGTSSKLPFEAKFGLIQDGVLSDEGLASVRLPTTLTGSTDISLSGTAKRTPTGFEYDITAERVSSGAKSYIQGSFSRAKGITCPPAVCYTDTDAATVYFAYINSLGEIYTARMAHGALGYDVAPTNVTLVGNLINSIDSDPMFDGVYANTIVHIWKSVLIKGIRRIRVPATVTVSGVPTAVVKMRVWMWGAAGQANKAVRGGPGGYVKFDHTVEPGEILSLLVGGYDGDGFGGCSSVAGVTSAPDVLDGQGGGGSFLWRGPTLRANLLGVAGGGGGGPGDARNTGLKIGGPGGSTAFGGGNGVSGSAMDVCMGKSTQSGAPKGSGGGGYVGGGNFTGVGYPGKGGTNFIIGTATNTTNLASAEDGSGYSTTTAPPGTGESVYTANQSYTWGRANVGVATNTQAKAGPGMIAIQWLTS